MVPQELKDARPPVDLPPDYAWLFFALTIPSLILVVLFLRWLRDRRRFAKAVPPVPRHPWDIALEQLNDLKKQNLPGQGNVKEYFIRLTDIVRHYIEGRFTISAPDMTTEEFLNTLKSSTVLNASQKDSLGEFLSHSDLVKFARGGASAQEMENAFAMAQRIVDETKEVDSPGG